MKRLAHITIFATVALAVWLALPAGALAGSGGTAPGGGAGGGGTAAPQPGDATLEAPTGALLHRYVRLSGQVGGGGAVLIQRLSPDGWQTVARTTADPDGTFTARWRPDVAGHTELRAVSGSGSGARASAVNRSTALTVYRPSRATWYGPGSYGKRTACGQRLTPRLVGVANRTLPCGTRVRVYYRGRTITAPVVDRGPYANGASWDLTTGAARALGVAETVTIGFLTAG